jgi:hypothetical protein
VSLSELDSRGYEVQICGTSIEVFCGDMTVIRGTRCDGLFKMIGTVESVSTVVSADAPTCRVVGGDD